MLMAKFSSFLTEAKSAAETTAKRTHLEPPGFLAFDGHDSVATADAHLRGFHDYLLGKKSSVKPTIKYDGAPHIRIGYDKDGNPYAGTKAVVGKNPRLFYNEQQVDDHYGEGHPVGEIIKHVIRHALPTLPKTLKAGESIGGDVLSTAGVRPPTRSKGFVSTQPNVINYKFPADSQEGRELADSKLGVVWHTKFDKNGKADALPDKDRAAMPRSKDVFNLDPAVKSNPANYTPEEQNAFHNHMENARRVYSSINPETYDRIAGHEATLRTYHNKAFRDGEEPSFEGYVQHLADRQRKDVDSVKTPAAKDRKTQQHAAFIEQAHGNRKELEKLLQLHNHLENAKKVLVGVADKNSVSANELPNGQPISHEGYVTNDKNGNAVKHVPDEVKSFLQSGLGAVAQAKAARSQQPIKEEAEQSNSVVAHYGKWRIPHRGHAEVAKKVAYVARKTGSDSEIALSGASNPLSFESKVRYARNMIPQANISSARHKNYLEYAADLNRRGYKTLHMVVGSDRADEFRNTLERYNGRPDKNGRILYHFPGGIHVHVAGQEREEGSQGVAGSSSSNQERYARAGDYNSFARNAPVGAKPEHVRAMYDEIRSSDLKRDKNNPLKENTTADAPSVAELSARGSMESGGKKKKINEFSGRIGFKAFYPIQKKINN